MQGNLFSGLKKIMRPAPKTDMSVLNIDGIGQITVRRSHRARRVVISVSPTKGVILTVPYRTSLQQALGFVEKKKGWIQKHLALIKQNEQRKQESGQKIQSINKAEAAKMLNARLHQLADQHGFKCNRVTIRQQRTRWGSCSPKCNISLNVNLYLLPEPLRDYVILHELVHTRYHNHSSKFWAELDKYVPNSKAISRQLRKNEIILL
jgi:predicted metal-dependent hydrolase